MTRAQVHTALSAIERLRKLVPAFKSILNELNGGQLRRVNWRFCLRRMSRQFTLKELASTAGVYPHLVGVRVDQWLNQGCVVRIGRGVYKKTPKGVKWCKGGK